MPGFRYPFSLAYGSERFYWFPLKPLQAGLAAFTNPAHGFARR